MYRRVLASSISIGRTFVIIELGNGKFLSIEITETEDDNEFPIDNLSTSAVEHDSIDELVASVTWHDWIKEGIIDNELKEKTKGK